MMNNGDVTAPLAAIEHGHGARYRTRCPAPRQIGFGARGPRAADAAAGEFGADVERADQPATDEWRFSAFKLPFVVEGYCPRRVLIPSQMAPARPETTIVTMVLIVKL